MIHALLSGLLLALPVQTSPQAQNPVDLGDIPVEGQTLREATEQFVREVGAPARNRGLARWRDGVCVGVANLQPQLGQAIADRVSDVARDVGLRAGSPGCHPSVLVVAVKNADAFTPAFVEMRPRLFRVGGAGMDRGGDALDRFKVNGRPVRWWVVSMPIDGDTGQIAVRTPGLVGGGADNGMPGNVRLFAPNIDVRAASRLSTQVVDTTARAFIIVDVDKLNGVSTEQLADYIAFVALAQVDMEADTGGYSTILNLFDAPDQNTGLTQWDRAYLKGLYDAQRTRQNVRANGSEIVAAIMDARRDMMPSQDDAQP